MTTALNFPVGAASAAPSASTPVQPEPSAHSAPPPRLPAAGANSLPPASAVAGAMSPGAARMSLPADTPRPLLQLVDMARQGTLTVTPQSMSISDNQRAVTLTGQSKDGSRLTITATASRADAKAPWSTRYELRADSFAHAVDQRPIDAMRGQPTRYTTSIAPLDKEADSKPIVHEVLPNTGEVNFRELAGGKVDALLDNFSLLNPISFSPDDVN